LIGKLLQLLARVSARLPGERAAALVFGVDTNDVRQPDRAKNLAQIRLLEIGCSAERLG